MSTPISAEECKNEFRSLAKAAKTRAECNVGFVCDAFEALSSLSEEKVDSKATAKMLKVARWIEPIYEEFTDARREAAARFGSPIDEEPGKFVIPKENTQAFVDALNAVAKKPITVPSVLKLALADLEGAKISTSVMLRMRWIMSDLDD